MKFTYDACASDGRIIQGNLVAQSLKEAQDQLYQQGLFIITLKAVADRTGICHKLLAWSLMSHNKLRFLSRFVQQLSTLSRAGLPLLACLQIMAEEATHPLYQEALTKLKHDVASGDSLATALAKQDHLFPQLVVQMTAAAEAAGKLEEVYSKLEILYKHELDIRRKIAGAATYPMLVLVLAVIGAIGVSKIVLPQVQELLAYSNAPWSLPTKILLHLGQPRFWYLLIIVLSLLVLSALILMRTPLGHDLCEMHDRFKLRLPLLGPLILRYHLARMVYCLGLCLDCGISLLAALDIAENTALNQSLAADIRRIKAGTQVGLSLAYQLRTRKLAPKFLISIVRVGEETGRLADMLQKAAEILDKEVGHALDMTVTWLEPLLIIVAGGFVGFIILGLMMPLLTLVDSLG